MSKCSICGADIPEGSSACPVCGAPAATESSSGSIYKLAGDNDAVGGIYDRNQEPDPKGFDPAADDMVSYGSGSYGSYGSSSVGGSSFSGGGYTEPARVKSKSGAIVAIILVLLCAIGVGAYFVINNLLSSPKKVAEEFVDAFEDYDIDKLVSLFPPELATQDDVEMLKQTFELYKSYGVSIKFKDVKYDVSKPYDKQSIKYLEQTLKEEGYDLTGKMDQVKTVKIDCKMEASYNGQSESQKYSITFVCAKIKGDWKIIGALQ